MKIRYEHAITVCEPAEASLEPTHLKMPTAPTTGLGEARRGVTALRLDETPPT